MPSYSHLTIHRTTRALHGKPPLPHSAGSSSRRPTTSAQPSGIPRPTLPLMGKGRTPSGSRDSVIHSQSKSVKDAAAGSSHKSTRTSKTSVPHDGSSGSQSPAGSTRLPNSKTARGSTSSATSTLTKPGRVTRSNSHSKVGTGNKDVGSARRKL